MEIAFPNETELRQLVLFSSLGEYLSVIAGEGYSSELIPRLIRWAIAHNRLEELITAACEAVPEREDLQALATSLGLLSTF